MGFLGCSIGIGEDFGPAADKLLLSSISGREVQPDAECCGAWDCGTHPSAPNEG